MGTPCKMDFLLLSSLPTQLYSQFFDPPPSVLRQKIVFPQNLTIKSEYIFNGKRIVIKISVKIKYDCAVLR